MTDLLDRDPVPSTWIIIYPRGDRSRIGIAEITPACDHERRDYALAARRDFYDDEPGAEAYARALAKQYGLTLDPDIPLLLDADEPETTVAVPHDEDAHEAYHTAMDRGAPVANTEANLRFLALDLYASGFGADLDPQSAAGQALLDTLLDAGEGRPFTPFNFNRA
ncbi:hypothetical protein KABACHOK_01140 [Brevundimonas phage vB_BpoS-Kabachok]|uniref:Uncharacterized protein n=1 Tax=Brevundimonas phage vB_BpoS-Kabachok TaxID=2948600 RepID=A0A9E7MP30_9CAUD|nr:hypothetical protein KABACHOK_01140 [Brevundimonas phage vB_BpoS-Kabachok]